MPFVPEYLSKLTIDKLPIEKAYYIDVDDNAPYDPPAVFVTPERRLHMSRSYSIDPEANTPASPLGRMGVMHITPVDPKTGILHDTYIADLRFLEPHQLADLNDDLRSAADPEERLAVLSILEDSVAFEGFIAPESGSNIDKAIPEGTFYGAPVLHPFLEQLQKRGTKIMKKHIKLETTPKKQRSGSKPDGKKGSKAKRS